MFIFMVVGGCLLRCPLFLYLWLNYKYITMKLSQWRLNMYERIAKQNKCSEPCMRNCNHDRLCGRCANELAKIMT